VRQRSNTRAEALGVAARALPLPRARFDVH
jgi:hypothetical protein